MHEDELVEGNNDGSETLEGQGGCFIEITARKEVVRPFYKKSTKMTPQACTIYA
jgi:hypothetical protein